MTNTGTAAPPGTPVQDLVSLFHTNLSEKVSDFPILQNFFRDALPGGSWRVLPGALLLPARQPLNLLYPPKRISTYKSAILAEY
jgi:hypothetical protein